MVQQPGNEATYSRKFALGLLVKHHRPAEPGCTLLVLSYPTPMGYLQSKQMADLRRRWKETKADSVKKHGTAEHLELPDIVIKHEITYEAPPGKANADRSMPIPRPVVSIFISYSVVE